MDKADDYFAYIDPYEAENLAEVYRIELVTALGALLVNLFVIIYAYTGDRFSPHTTMLRTVLIIDILTNVGHICEAFSSLFGDPIVRQLSLWPIPEDAHYVSISDCSVAKPYLFLMLLGRQWSSAIVLVMGLERFLFVVYPLWFRVIRVRRGPIIMFTLTFVMLSASIGYTNSLFVSPQELSHSSCEVTWAFGDNYG
ncbi:hypothetical protein AAVH_02736 [Aphelenchoides avenae]|nr:hypothetical protein AAVH_02736 [Aphelenchus avenae]